MELSDIRKEIDQIDEQLLSLLCRRMDCSAQVAVYKKEHRLPVLNAEREKEILQQVAQGGDQYAVGYGDALSLVFASIMDASRALQHQQLAAGGLLREQISQAERQLMTDSQTKVVCQGVPGSYSNEACACLFQESQPSFVSTFREVFDAVARGEAGYGILPVENSSAGSVNDVYDLILQYRFTIAAAVELPIHHCLLACPGASKDSIETVYSHHQALAQCADYIAAQGLEARTYENTASAAKMIAHKGDKKCGAIASKNAANLYGLEIVEENIQSVNDNCTRFIAISRKLIIPQNADKISLIFSLPHVTGSLYRTLSRFAMAGLNLTKLESRPIRGSGFQYIFYLDFEGSLLNPGTVELLCALSEEMPSFSFLGNYKLTII